MPFNFVTCSYCGKAFLKDSRYINENKKLGHKSYCSLKCQYAFKNQKIELTCENSTCNNKFKRKPKDISPHNFCSRSCSITINNKKYPKIVAKTRRCISCNILLSVYRKYCSIECKSNALTLSQEKVTGHIGQFYKKFGRIPFKREMWGIYKPARKYYGTWNNAITAAGFEPNPVMFAKHHIAKDGHKCDSLAEKIIDDYLFRHKIQHERCISYPESECTADFKIGNKWVEYFGLAGEHKRYDQLRKIKQRIARKYSLNLVEVYPKDLYKNNKLNQLLDI